MWYMCLTENQVNVVRLHEVPQKNAKKILSFEKMYISLQREELFDILNNENGVRVKYGHLVASASILTVARTLSWKTIYPSGL